MSNVVIRQAIRKDAHAIHELHTHSVKELCIEFYTEEQIHGWLDHRTPDGYHQPIDQGTLFVAVKDSKIVGFNEAVPGEVVALYISPDYINEGIGTLLLNHAMSTALLNEKITLTATLNATGFYLKKGFVEVDRITTRHGNTNLPCVYMEFNPKI